MTGERLSGSLSHTPMLSASSPGWAAAWTLCRLRRLTQASLRLVLAAAVLPLLAPARHQAGEGVGDQAGADVLLMAEDDDLSCVSPRARCQVDRDPVAAAVVAKAIQPGEPTSPWTAASGGVTTAVIAANCQGHGRDGASAM